MAKTWLRSEIFPGTDCDYETSDYEAEKVGYRWAGSSQEGDNEDNAGESENNNVLSRQK